MGRSQKSAACQYLIGNVGFVASSRPGISESDPDISCHFRTFRTRGERLNFGKRDNAVLNKWRETPARAPCPGRWSGPGVQSGNLHQVTKRCLAWNRLFIKKLLERPISGNLAQGFVLHKRRNFRDLHTPYG
jgi:hypothetical protein